MSIGIRDRVQLLTRSLGQNRRKAVVFSLTAAFLSILIFILGTGYLLFRSYMRTVDAYYGSILKGAAFFTRGDFREGESYRLRMMEIAGWMKANNGVEEVWFADRYGKLIYHTDESMLSEYGSKRLPFAYHDNIEHVWQFSGGLPDVKSVRVGWNRLRLSVPLYGESRESYSFVMGLDVRRFIILPDENTPVIPFFALYVILSLALLFFPLFLLFTRYTKELEKQAMVLMGTAVEGRTAPSFGGTDRRPAGGEEREERSREEPPREEPSPVATPPQESPRETPEGISEERREEREAPRPASIEEIPPEGAADEEGGVSAEGSEGQAPPPPEFRETGEGGEEAVEEESPQERIATDEESRLARFFEIRDRQFKEQKVELQFIQAASCILHSENIEGSYLFSHKSKSSHFYCLFSSPRKDVEHVRENIPEMRAYFRRGLSPEVDLKSQIMQYNEYCRERRYTIAFSILHIDGRNIRAEYASCGNAYGLYLKKNGEEVRQLRLDVPRLGVYDMDQFGDAFEAAEISFDRDDLFILMPPNGNTIKMGEQNLEEILTSLLLADRSLSAEKVCAAVRERYLHLEEDTRKGLPQTGFAAARFL